MATKSGGSVKSILTRIFNVLLLITVTIFVTKSMHGYREDIARVRELDFATLAFGFSCCLVYRISNAHGWSYVLDALGQKLKPTIALRIWLTSEACRWLPGSVWSYGSRTLQARRQGISAMAAGSSLLLELLLTVFAWCVVAAIGMYVYREAFASQLDKIPDHVVRLTGQILLILALAVVGMSRAFHISLSAKFEMLQHQLYTLTAMRPNKRSAFVALAYYVAMCFLHGIAFKVILDAAVPHSDVPLLAACTANGVSWLIGFFAILAPGGLVVRESVLAAMLATWMPGDHALAAAIIWRLVQVAAELACMFLIQIPYFQGQTDTTDSLSTPLELDRSTTFSVLA